MQIDDVFDLIFRDERVTQHLDGDGCGGLGLGTALGRNHDFLQRASPFLGERLTWSCAARDCDRSGQGRCADPIRFYYFLQKNPPRQMPLHW